MANKFATLLANAKTRTLVLVVIGVLVFGVVIAVSTSGEGPSSTSVTERTSTTAEVPSTVRSTPGEQVSRRYQELQEQANIRGAQEAAERGETFIPTLVGSAEGYDDTDFEKQLSAAFDDLGGKCSKEEAERLKGQGMNTSEVIIQLKCYGCSAEAIGAIFNCNEITNALISTSGCPGSDLTGCTTETVQAMRDLGYNARKVAEEMKKNGCSGENIAKAMSESGFTSAEIAQAMIESGFSAAEVAKGLRAAGVDISEIANALKAAGLDASQIASALDQAGFDRSQIMAALESAGFSPLEIARAMSSLDLEGADAAALLAQQQADEDEARRRSAQEEAQRLAAFSQQRQNRIDELTAAMESVKEEAFQTWTNIAEQQYIEGEWAAVRLTPQQILAGGTVQNPNGSAVNGDEDDRPIILKAGSILFGTLDTAVNSDEPGPVLATVIGGSLKGSKLMGTMQVNTDGENIGINFTAINMPNEAKSMGIAAVAIDPDTARTALSTDVDHHYLLRWGSLFASAFMEGYASAVASSGATQTTSQGAAGTVTTTTQPALSGKQQLFAGLAAVGTKWSEVVARNFERPVTITIDQGTGIGILVTADLEFGTDPIYYTPPDVASAAQAEQAQAQAAATAGTQAQGVTPEQAAALLTAIQSAATGTTVAAPATSVTPGVLGSTPGASSLPAAPNTTSVGGTQ